MAGAGRVGPWVSVPRQAGRTVVVTGATSGIGLATARASWRSESSRTPRSRRVRSAHSSSAERKFPWW